MASTNQSIIRSFIAAWSNLDAQELIGYFSVDGTYHNMMLPPVTGHSNLLPYIDRFVSGWSATEWEVLNILAQGDVVIAERLDKTRIGDRHIALPCVGVFEMQAGKIKVWRDYFDLNTYSKALA